MNWTDQGVDVTDSQDTDHPGSGFKALRINRIRDMATYYEGHCIDVNHVVRLEHEFDRDGRCYFCPARTET